MVYSDNWLKHLHYLHIIYLRLYIFMLVCIVSPTGARQVNATITLRCDAAVS